MKKMMIGALLGILVSFPSMAYAARAIVIQIEQAYKDLDGNLIFQVGVLYLGADVPNSPVTDAAQANMSGVTNITQAEAAIAAAVREKAVSNGYTVGANQVLMNPFVAR